jgi:ribosomal protein S3
MDLTNARVLEASECKVANTAAIACHTIIHATKPRSIIGSSISQIKVK